MSPSMIVFCKVFWKMHVFMYCRRKLTLGASRDLHAAGQEMDHVANTWSTRGDCIYVLPSTYNHGGAA